MNMLIIIITIFSVLNGQDSMVGSAYAFGSNAREVSLSNTLVSNYNKGNNPFTNPALLGSVNDMEYGFSHFSMSLDRYIQSLSIVLPMPDEQIAIGISFYKAGTKNIPMNQSQPDDYYNLGYYNVWEGYGMCSFGAKFSDKISGGMNLKLFRNEIAKQYTASGFGTDLGLLYEFSHQNKLGILINNLYSKYSWDFDYQGERRQYDERFPIILSIGFSSYINEKVLVLSQVDYVQTNDELSYKSGVELDMFSIKKLPFKVRVGFNYIDDKLNSSLGVGLKIPIRDSFNIGVDYAFDTGMDDTFNHLFTITFYRE